MQRNIFICLCILITWFIYSYLFGSNGQLVYNELTKTIAKQQAINQEALIRNNNLISRVNYVKGSKASFEANVRYNLNLIKDGEKVIFFPDTKVFIKNDKK